MNAAPPPGLRQPLVSVTSLPSLVWLILFFALPSLLILWLSFKPATPAGGFGNGWTLENWRLLMAPANLTLALRTLTLGVATAALCLTVAVPTAYFIARQPVRRRHLYLAAVMLPFLTSFLVRIYAWKVLLHPEGWLKQALVSLGLMADQALLMYRPVTVLLVLVHAYLPFAILPIYAAAVRFDFTLLEAARDLGAGRLQAFTRVFLPGISRGLGMALLMVLIPALGAYVIPDLVGGVNGQMLGNKISQRALTDLNLPGAAALAACLALAVLLPARLWLAWQRREVRS